MSNELIVQNLDLFGVDVFEIYKKCELSTGVPPEFSWMYMDYKLAVDLKRTTADLDYLDAEEQRLKERIGYIPNLQLQSTNAAFNPRPTIEFYNYLLLKNYCFFHSQTLINKPSVEVW